jgi:hypothetical protein
VSKRLGSPYRAGRTDEWIRSRTRPRPRSSARPKRIGAASERGGGTAFGKGVFGQ